MNTLPAYPRIPYGEADFMRIRRNGWLYVDKTRFLRRLEQERYAFLIRPRRFGKSLWVTLLEPDFNEMVGFTAAEVRGLVEMYCDLGVFNQDAATVLGIMGEWYNGYRFAEEAETDLYNSDMVLYYLKRSMPNRSVPTYLIDSNVRIDYGKLRHLLTVGRRIEERSLNGNFDLLRGVIGEERAAARIQPSFPAERLDDGRNFLSLLHFFGLLSIRGASQGPPHLVVPNRTAKQILHGYLRDGYRE